MNKTMQELLQTIQGAILQVWLAKLEFYEIKEIQTIWDCGLEYEFN